MNVFGLFAVVLRRQRAGPVAETFELIDRDIAKSRQQQSANRLETPTSQGVAVLGLTFFR